MSSHYSIVEKKECKECSKRCEKDSYYTSVAAIGFCSEQQFHIKAAAGKLRNCKFFNEENRIVK
jgi:hypothetical protein